MAEESSDGAEAIVRNYCVAAQNQAAPPGASTMEVEIQGALPKLSKTGKLHALRRISALGRITYEVLGFEGDGTVKRDLIARYLAAEIRAQQDHAAAMAVTPDNYRFHFKGRSELDGRQVYWFQVAPKHKAQGLYKGDLWIDAVTYLKVQESGYLVKSPSIFLKRVAFTRKYETRDGRAVPLRMESVVDTRLVGRAELTIDYSNYALDETDAMDDAR
ncbi:MAG: hypothetical protein WAJ87_00295 [Bryobacteraceae bacterium]